MRLFSPLPFSTRFSFPRPKDLVASLVAKRAAGRRAASASGAARGPKNEEPHVSSRSTYEFSLFETLVSGTGAGVTFPCLININEIKID